MLRGEPRNEPSARTSPRPLGVRMLRSLARMRKSRSRRRGDSEPSRASCSPPATRSILRKPTVSPLRRTLPSPRAAVPRNRPVRLRTSMSTTPLLPKPLPRASMRNASEPGRSARTPEGSISRARPAIRQRSFGFHSTSPFRRAVPRSSAALTSTMSSRPGFSTVRACTSAGGRVPASTRAVTSSRYGCRPLSEIVPRGLVTTAGPGFSGQRKLSQRPFRASSGPASRSVTLPSSSARTLRLAVARVTCRSDSTPRE